MSDPRTLLRAAEAELARTEALASQWREAVAALRRVVGKQAVLAPVAVPESSNHDLSELSGPKAAEVVLREGGAALRIGEIVRVMQARGFNPQGDFNKIKGSLYTNMMRQRSTFKRVGRGRFDLAHR